MTASSPKVGRSLFPAAYQSADDPLDAALLRNAIANNALHAGDCAAKVWVNWVAAKTSLMTGNPQQYMTLDTLGASDTWYLMAAFGPWPLAVWESGRRPYLLRFAVLAQAGSGTATFAIAFGPRGRARARIDGASSDAAQFVGTTAASPTWLTPASGVDTITISEDTLGLSIVPRSTLDDTGGVFVETLTHELEASVWVKQSSIGTSARLYGVHIAEFVG